MVTIKNRNYLFFLFMLLFLTCEDKKKERNDFGSISINIIFENQVADSPVNDSGSDRVIEDSEVIMDSLKQFLKEGKQITEDEKLAVEEDDFLAVEKNKHDLVSSIKEKTRLFSSVKYVTITVGELDPVELTLSGTTASTTIDDIPIGPQAVTIELSNSEKIILYHQTQTVTIENGETATPTFNKFTVSNESIQVTKPNGGESFEPGKNMTIEWTRSHESIPVNIDLYKNNTKTTTIQNSASNNGIKTWNIPTSLIPSSTYQIKITSTNSASVSDFSDNYFSVIDVVEPAVPSGLSATAGDKQVVLTWSANSESDLKSYKVYGGTSASPTALLSTVNAGTETYTHTSLTNGTTYYYRISAVDNSGNESSKTSDVNATPVLPGGGNALSFDGTDDDVVIENNLDVFSNSSYTINFFFNANGQSGSELIGKTLVSKAKPTPNLDGWAVFITQDNGGQLLFVYTANGGTAYLRGPTVSSFADNNWHNVTITYSSAQNNAKFYLDGVLHETANTFGSDNLDSNIDIFLGKDRQSSSTSYFKGKIDELAFWSNALTEDEVTNIYNSGTALDVRTNSGDYSSTADLKGYWKMEDGNGTTLTDVSGYGNDGTIDGASWTTGVSSTSYDNTPKLIDITAPAVPSGLSATAGDEQVVLTWTANSESDLASYKVYGGTSASPTTLLSTVNTGTETYTHTGLTNGTTYYYRISAVDNSGNESSKTSDVNATPVVPGGGNALSFDGNDKVKLAGISSTDATGSLSLWVKPTDIYIENIVFQATDADLMLTLHETKGVCFGINTSSGRKELCQSVTISDYKNRWNHIIGVYDGSNIIIYVNGSSIGTITHTGNVSLSSSDDLLFGLNSSNNTDGLNGVLDEVGYWNDALSASEVTALYNSGTALDARTNAGDYSSTLNLIGYWKIEDGSGTTLTDVSGYGNDGTINGASWTTGVLSTSYDNTPKVIDNSSVTVKTDGTGDYTSIQSAIDAVSSGGTITVYDGTYKVNNSGLTVDNKTVTIVSANGKSSTIIDGESQNRIMTIKNNDSHIFTLDGFTITNGHALANSGYVISAENGTNSFKNLILENSGQNTGNSLFRGNHRDSTTFEACIIRNNKSENGAGIRDATLINCLVYGNSGWNNTSPVSRSNVINSTIVNNGGGASNPWTTGGISHSYLVVNSIIRGNGGAGQIYDPDNTMTLSYSNTPGYSGNGIINADPLFVNESNHDYHLQDGSPCIAAGTTTNAPSTDLDGNTRPAPSGTNPDMGAYENGTISGGGNALSFDGTDDIVSGTASSSLDVTSSNRLTIAAWVNAPSNQTGRIFTHGTSNSKAQYVLSLSSGKVYFLSGDGAFESGGGNISNNALTADEWNFVTMTYDGTAVKIYINSALDFTHTVTDNFTQAQDYIGKLFIGGLIGSEAFNGNIDEVGIWNDALTAAEITTLYNSGTALDARTNSGNYISSDNLKGYWKMEDGSGTTLTDVSGYANDGTINGASWTTGVLSTSYDNTPKSIDSEAPVTPTGLKATPTSDGGVKLTWIANSESDLASYNVYGSTAASPTTLLSTVVSGTETYTQTNLSRGETYYYRISAVDNGGNESDKTSDAASGLVSHVTLDHSVSEYEGRIGLTGTGEWQAMSRWVTSDYTSQGIGSNNNLYLKKITFYAGDDVDSTTYKLLAWKGTLGSSPVMTESVSPTVDALNAITLSSPVELDASNPIMFGMSYNQLHDGQYPGGRDTGPAVQNGDLISTDAGGSWVSMSSEYSLDYNWLLSGQLIDNDDVFVEALTVDFTSASNVESSTLTSGQSYYLRVTGTASYCCSGGTNGVDAAYYFRGEQGQLIDNPSPWTPTDNGWSWNGQTGAIRRPSPDSYSPHHIYYYYFTGDGSTELFEFRDSGYGDNSGSLKIEIWENK
jgi:hypothetical protein